jgi:FMN phosphatase YigB (HAD superfamily)
VTQVARGIILCRGLRLIFFGHSADAQANNPKVACQRVVPSEGFGENLFCAIRAIRDSRLDRSAYLSVGVPHVVTLSVIRTRHNNARHVVCECRLVCVEDHRDVGWIHVVYPKVSPFGCPGHVNDSVTTSRGFGQVFQLRCVVIRQVNRDDFKLVRIKVVSNCSTYNAVRSCNCYFHAYIIADTVWYAYCDMRITTVLFDIGNVLSHDGHETYLTHERYGLARQLGLPKDEVNAKVNHVFRKYAVKEHASEAAFWNEIGDALGLKLSPETIAEVKRHVDSSNPEAIAAFEYLRGRGIRIGVISNSTPVFYEPQTEPLLLNEYADPTLLFLSHKQGVLKSDGLFEIAAAAVDPRGTYIIEDRAKNIAYAQRLGFHVAQYSLESGESLLALVKRIVDSAAPRPT